PDTRQRLLAQLLDAVRASGNHDVALLEGVPDGSALAEALTGTTPLAGCSNTAAILDLTVFSRPEDYTAGLSKTQRRNRNRRRNLLAREGALSFAVLFPGDPGYAAALDECVQQKRLWLTETG